jgi:hypothetical protein
VQNSERMGTSYGVLPAESSISNSFRSKQAIKTKKKKMVYFELLCGSCVIEDLLDGLVSFDKVLPRVSSENAISMKQSKGGGGP